MRIILLATTLILFACPLLSQESFKGFRAGAPFNSVFQHQKSGQYSGTLNGVLILQHEGGKQTILDFQGSDCSFSLEEDEHEIYDVSFKIYNGTTTSGKTNIQYRNYADANELVISLSSGDYRAGAIDGACDMVIDGIQYHYVSEPSAEYLILQVDKEVSMSNFHWTAQNMAEDQSKDFEKIEAKSRKVRLMPNSTLVWAIQR